MVVRVVFVDADRQCIAAGVSCAVTDDKRADVLLCQPVQHFLPISRHTHIIPDNAGTPQTLTSHLTHHSLTHLMPLLLTVFCFSKIQTGFTFLVPAHPGSPAKGH